MIIKCKMCGGDIEFKSGDTYGECDHCGSTCTIPKVDEEQKLNRFNRANHFRRQGEFDKAISAYEKILEEDDTDAEAHWGAALSRFGIEYVEDPATKRRVPTCHRVQVESILADADYQAALEHAPDATSRNLYEEQAKEIAEIQKGILAISANEKPYDIFICYKETDEQGRRTRDSALAQEVYYGLTEQGYKVFFSRITLEDKLGQEYEPYIFAALHSAKVMVVIGTKAEYFSAVWVKNEWSRYLHLMKEDRKRLLIPCYRDMDPYDLPDELSSLQSQDMSKIGFIQDLIRGVNKVLGAEKKQAPVETAAPVQQVVQQVIQEGNSNVNALLDRAYLSLEDGEFTKADEFCEQALNLDAKNTRAYIGKLMAERKVRKADALSQESRPLTDSNAYQRAIRFATPEQKKQLEGWNQTILDRNERNRKIKIREDALAKLKQAMTVQDCENVQNILRTIYGFEGVTEAGQACEDKKLEINEKNYQNALGMVKAHRWEQAISNFQLTLNYKDSTEQIRECEEEIRKTTYQQAIQYKQDGKWDNAMELFRQLKDYRNSKALIAECQETKEAEEKAKKEEQERKRQEAERIARENAAKKKRIAIISAAAAIVAIAVFVVVTKVIIPKGHYDKGISLTAAGQWDDAIAEFEESQYSDYEIQILKTRYTEGIAKREKQDWDGAVAAFEAAGHYEDAAKQILAMRYQEGMIKQGAQDWDGAVAAFEAAGNYEDAVTQILETRYQQAKSLYEQGNYDDSYAVYNNIGGYKDVDNILTTDDHMLAAAREAKIAPFKTVGSIVTIGKYEQDNNIGNSAEDIEWVVLDVQDGKSLLLSKYGLDAKAYNNELTSVTWETCTLRKWLNNDFLKSAFSSDEQKAILIMNVDNSKSQGYSRYSTNGGNNTQDQIFLLSYHEAFKLYFTSDSARKCTPTSYAVSQGAMTSNSEKVDGKATGMWWLRSPGDYLDFAASVNLGGSHNDYVVDIDYGCIRPAFWINLESDIF